MEITHINHIGSAATHAGMDLLLYDIIDNSIAKHTIPTPYGNNKGHFILKLTLNYPTGIGPARPPFFLSNLNKKCKLTMSTNMENIVITYPIKI